MYTAKKPNRVDPGNPQALSSIKRKSSSPLIFNPKKKNLWFKKINPENDVSDDSDLHAKDLIAKAPAVHLYQPSLDKMKEEDKEKERAQLKPEPIKYTDTASILKDIFGDKIKPSEPIIKIMGEEIPKDTSTVYIQKLKDSAKEDVQSINHLKALEEEIENLMKKEKVLQEGTQVQKLEYGTGTFFSEKFIENFINSANTSLPDDLSNCIFYTQKKDQRNYADLIVNSNDPLRIFSVPMEKMDEKNINFKMCFDIAELYPLISDIDGSKIKQTNQVWTIPTHILPAFERSERPLRKFLTGEEIEDAQKYIAMYLNTKKLGTLFGIRPLSVEAQVIGQKDEIPKLFPQKPAGIISTGLLNMVKDIGVSWTGSLTDMLKQIWNKHLQTFRMISRSVEFITGCILIKYMTKLYPMYKDGVDNAIYNGILSHAFLLAWDFQGMAIDLVANALNILSEWLPSPVMDFFRNVRDWFNNIMENIPWLKNRQAKEIANLCIFLFRTLSFALPLPPIVNQLFGAGFDRIGGSWQSILSSWSWGLALGGAGASTIGSIAAGTLAATFTAVNSAAFIANVWQSTLCPAVFGSKSTWCKVFSGVDKIFASGSILSFMSMSIMNLYALYTETTITPFPGSTVFSLSNSIIPKDGWEGGKPIWSFEKGVSEEPPKPFTTTEEEPTFAQPQPPPLIHESDERNPNKDEIYVDFPVSVQGETTAMTKLVKITQGRPYTSEFLEHVAPQYPSSTTTSNDTPLTVIINPEKNVEERKIYESLAYSTQSVPTLAQNSAVTAVKLNVLAMVVSERTTIKDYGKPGSDLISAQVKQKYSYYGQVFARPISAMESMPSVSLTTVQQQSPIIQGLLIPLFHLAAKSPIYRLPSSLESSDKLVKNAHEFIETAITTTDQQTFKIAVTGAFISESIANIINPQYYPYLPNDQQKIVSSLLKEVSLASAETYAQLISEQVAVNLALVTLADNAIKNNVIGNAIVAVGHTNGVKKTIKGLVETTTILRGLESELEELGDDRAKLGYFIKIVESYIQSVYDMTMAPTPIPTVIDSPQISTLTSSAVPISPTSIDLSSMSRDKAIRLTLLNEFAEANAVYHSNARILKRNQDIATALKECSERSSSFLKSLFQMPTCYDLSLTSHPDDAKINVLPIAATEIVGNILSSSPKPEEAISFLIQTYFSDNLKSLATFAENVIYPMMTYLIFNPVPSASVRAHVANIGNEVMKIAYDDNPKVKDLMIVMTAYANPKQGLDTNRLSFINQNSVETLALGYVLNIKKDIKEYQETGKILSSKPFEYIASGAVSPQMKTGGAATILLYIRNAFEDQDIMFRKNMKIGMISSSAMTHHSMVTRESAKNVMPLIISLLMTTPSTDPIDISSIAYVTTTADDLPLQNKVVSLLYNRVTFATETRGMITLPDIHKMTSPQIAVIQYMIIMASPTFMHEVIIRNMIAPTLFGMIEGSGTYSNEAMNINKKWLKFIETSMSDIQNRKLTIEQRAMFEYLEKELTFLLQPTSNYHTMLDIPKDYSNLRIASPQQILPSTETGTRLALIQINLAAIMNTQFIKIDTVNVQMNSLNILHEILNRKTITSQAYVDKVSSALKKNIRISKQHALIDPQTHKDNKVSYPSEIVDILKDRTTHPVINNVVTIYTPDKDISATLSLTFIKDTLLSWSSINQAPVEEQRLVDNMDKLSIDGPGRKEIQAELLESFEKNKYALTKSASLRNSWKKTMSLLRAANMTNDLLVATEKELDAIERTKISLFTIHDREDQVSSILDNSPTPWVIKDKITPGDSALNNEIFKQVNSKLIASQVALLHTSDSEFIQNYENYVSMLKTMSQISYAIYDVDKITSGKYDIDQNRINGYTADSEFADKIYSTFMKDVIKDSDIMSTVPYVISSPKINPKSTELFYMWMQRSGDHANKWLHALSSSLIHDNLLVGSEPSTSKIKNHVLKTREEVRSFINDLKSGYVPENLRYLQRVGFHFPAFDDKSHGMQPPPIQKRLRRGEAKTTTTSKSNSDSTLMKLSKETSNNVQIQRQQEEQLRQQEQEQYEQIRQERQKRQKREEQLRQEEEEEEYKQIQQEQERQEYNQRQEQERKQYIKEQNDMAEKEKNDHNAIRKNFEYDYVAQQDLKLHDIAFTNYTQAIESLKTGPPSDFIQSYRDRIIALMIIDEMTTKLYNLKVKSPDPKSDSKRKEIFGVVNESYLTFIQDIIKESPAYNEPCVIASPTSRDIKLLHEWETLDGELVVDKWLNILSSSLIRDNDLLKNKDVFISPETKNHIIQTREQMKSFINELRRSVSVDPKNLREYKFPAFDEELSYDSKIKYDKDISSIEDELIALGRKEDALKVKVKQITELTSKNVPTNKMSKTLSFPMNDELIKLKNSLYLDGGKDKLNVFIESNDTPWYLVDILDPKNVENDLNLIFDINRIIDEKLETLSSTLKTGPNSDFAKNFKTYMNLFKMKNKTALKINTVTQGSIPEHRMDWHKWDAEISEMVYSKFIKGIIKESVDDSKPHILLSSGPKDVELFYNWVRMDLRSTEKYLQILSSYLKQDDVLYKMTTSPETKSNIIKTRENIKDFIDRVRKSMTTEFANARYFIEGFAKELNEMESTFLSKSSSSSSLSSTSIPTSIITIDNVSETRNNVSETRNNVSETRNNISETRSDVLKTRNNMLETRNDVLEAETNDAIASMRPFMSMPSTQSLTHDKSKNPYSTISPKEIQKLYDNARDKIQNAKDKLIRTEDDQVFIDNYKSYVDAFNEAKKLTEAIHVPVPDSSTNKRFNEVSSEMFNYKHYIFNRVYSEFIKPVMKKSETSKYPNIIKSPDISLNADNVKLFYEWKHTANEDASKWLRILSNSLIKDHLRKDGLPTDERLHIAQTILDTRQFIENLKSKPVPYEVRYLQNAGFEFPAFDNEKYGMKAPPPAKRARRG